MKLKLRFAVCLATWTMAVLAATVLSAQQPNCVLQWGLWNQERYLPGQVQAECPGSPHSWPFGNWGVDSNFGSRIDGNQFQGWCHNSVVCGYDDPPTCWIDCTDGWYEWNSCTDYFPMLRGNCYYYNYNNCNEQKTSTGVNSHAGGYDTIPVTCPIDWNGDQICDSGGCMDLGAYWSLGNWMDVWELDPWDWDEWVAWLSFPDLYASLPCNPQSCGFGQSPWVTSNQTYPLSTQISLAVHWASFSDPSNYCAQLAMYDQRYNCW